MKYYSHVVGNKREAAEDHCELVEEYAEFYGKEIGFPKFMRINGYSHDLGKLTEKFQAVLAKLKTLINHAIPGAAAVVNELSQLFEDDVYGAQVAFGLISGHHAGLTGCFRPGKHRAVIEKAKAIRNDFGYIQDGKENSLSNETEYREIARRLKAKNFEKPENVTKAMRGKLTEWKMLFVRLAASCLIDADYTSTGEFEDGKKYIPPQTVDFETLGEALERYKKNVAVSSNSNVEMNRLREVVYQNAKDAGEKADFGLYTMTAPTGSGKTIAMMKFAIGCAKRNGQRRVFVVLPYLTIIEQNVATYKEAFYEYDVVMEDDSSVSYESDDTERASYMRLVSKKWDFQIIVTTNVKYFGTLFSSRPSELRKLHSVANSVILIDEYQTLPSDVTDLTVNTLEGLKDYRTTVLLSTATPPDLKLRKGIKATTKEIIADVDGLYEAYEKCHAVKTEFREKPIHFRDIERETRDEKRVLYIVNTTTKARRLYEVVRSSNEDAETFILYTRMCKAHRKKVIEKVKRVLADGKKCRLVSTQCVEAGVDVDFPVVYREYAPLPSLIQSAGRCNRNGNGIGKFVVFLAEDTGRSGYPDVNYMTKTAITYRIVKSEGFKGEISDPKLQKKYYERVYSGDGPETGDKKTLVEAVAEMDFVKVDEEYQIIEEKERTFIIVPYDDGKGTYAKVRSVLEQRNYVTDKKTTHAAEPIAVSLYSNSRETVDVISACMPIYMPGPYGERKTNWYLMPSEADGYGEGGIVTESQKGEMII